MTTSPDFSATELTDDAGALGVETEEETFHDIDRPWNPDSIRVSTKSFSLRNMVDLIKENALDLNPDFQRLRVWKVQQKAQLIESILLQIPLPAFYFAEDSDGILRVVDGVQRLSTINDFVTGGPDGKSQFKLDGLEYIADLAGKYFKDLPALWQRRLYNTQIIAHVIDPTTPAPVMYDIFRRINTGGTPLNAQEIRHCMSSDRSRNFLVRLTNLPEFDMATAGLLKNQRRMIDREVALRFVAFWLHGSEGYAQESMEAFLFETTALIDNKLLDNELEDIVDSFQLGLQNAYKVFGGHAYRKWPDGDDYKKPFNRALFESWTVELARVRSELSDRAAEIIRRKTRERMAEDPSYIASISSSTGDRNRVSLRFHVARTIVKKALA